jgi:hypothetical protein
MEVDQNVIWSAESSSSEVAIPEDVRRKMTQGRKFLWDVVARSAAAEKIGSINLQFFHISITSR